MSYVPTTWTSGMPITVARLNNLEAGIQSAPANAVSTTSVVANAVSKTTTVKDAANRSTTGTGYTDSGAAITFTVDVAGSTVILFASGRTYLSGGANECYVGYNVDGGADVLGWDMYHLNGAFNSFAFMAVLTGLAAGSHTINLRTKNDSGVTFSLRGDLVPTNLVVIEHKR